MKTNPGKPLIVIIVFALLFTSLVSCGPAQPPPEETTEPPAEKPTEPPTEEPTEPPAEAEPVTLRIGTTYIWDTPNPNLAWYGYEIRHLLYETVWEWNGLSNYGPGLAEEWSMSDDGLVWTFTIREGVTFHDGTPCTAEEIAWSINWTIEYQFSSDVTVFEEVVALDATTLQITLSRPVSNLLTGVLPFLWIQPRSLWEGMTYDQVMEFDGLEAAAGTGPYKLVEWVEGEYLILEAFEDYWQGKPPIDRIIYQEFATDDAIVQALLAGEADVGKGISYTSLETLEKTEGVHAAIMPSFSVDDFIINSHEAGTQPASLMDPDVRLAMAYAMDKQQIINVAYLGHAEPATVIVPPAMGDYHNDEIEDIPFDPDEGNRVLEGAGYVDSDGDGIREDLEGNPMEYRFYGEDGATEARAMEIIADGLSQIGISAPPTLLDVDSMLALYPEFDFDLLFWGWDFDADPDLAMLVFTCDERAEGGWQDSGYCDEEFDAMYAAQDAALTHEERREILWEMQEKLFEDRPYVMLTYRPTVEAYRSDRFALSEACGFLVWKACLLQAEDLP